MTRGETNGLKKYLIGLAVWLTGAIATGAMVTYTGMKELRVEIQWLKQSVENHSQRIERLEKPDVIVKRTVPNS